MTWSVIDVSNCCANCTNSFIYYRIISNNREGTTVTYVIEYYVECDDEQSEIESVEVTLDCDIAECIEIPISAFDCEFTLSLGNTEECTCSPCLPGGDPCCLCDFDPGETRPCTIEYEFFIPFVGTVTKNFTFDLTRDAISCGFFADTVHFIEEIPGGEGYHSIRVALVCVEENTVEDCEGNFFGPLAILVSMEVSGSSFTHIDPCHYGMCCVPCDPLNCQIGFNPQVQDCNVPCARWDRDPGVLETCSTIFCDGPINMLIHYIHIGGTCAGGGGDP